jgi:hypothetical protein
MKIFVFTTAFAPKIGGIERLTEMLVRESTAMGHEVVVATLTPGSSGPSRRLHDIPQMGSMVRRAFADEY